MVLGGIIVVLVVVSIGTCSILSSSLDVLVLSRNGPVQWWCG